MGAAQWIALEQREYWEEIEVAGSRNSYSSSFASVKQLSAISDYQSLQRYQLVIGEIEHFPFCLEERFDLVFSSAAFEHIARLPAALEKMYKALVPNGKLFAVFAPSLDLDYTVTPDYYKGDPNGGYRAYVYTDHLAPEEIVALRDQVEKEVRTALSIPYYSAQPALRYEHSMGQGFPSQLLRVSAMPQSRLANNFE
jgi:SAM-dependent methyltransferase